MGVQLPLLFCEGTLFIPEHLCKLRLKAAMRSEHHFLERALLGCPPSCSVASPCSCFVGFGFSSRSPLSVLLPPEATSMSGCRSVRVWLQPKGVWLPVRWHQVHMPFQTAWARNPANSTRKIKQKCNLLQRLASPGVASVARSARHCKFCGVVLISMGVIMLPWSCLESAICQQDLYIAKPTATQPPHPANCKKTTTKYQTTTTSG